MSCGDGSLPPAPKEHRSASLIQGFFTCQLEYEGIPATSQRQAELLAGLLSVYDQVPASAEQHHHQVDSPGEDFFGMLTLEFGVIMARALLDWMEGVIQRIKNGKHNRKSNAPHKEEL